ncbi:MAG: hypothetical protein QM709_11855 [Spongiibacteraceae bacterium]
MAPTSSNPQDTLGLLAGITAVSLIPAEVPTSRKILRQADCYQQRGIKYPHRGTFHSYAELLHFALCEGDALVTAFIPQPFKLRVCGRIYIPDAYVVRGGERIVIELKPRGEFDPALQRQLEAFFQFHRMRFEVVSNESVLEREIEALNWLHIVRTLCAATELMTDPVEHDLWRRFLTEHSIAFSDLLDPNNRRDDFTDEVALYRLLHRGQLRPHWHRSRLGFNTVIERCT